MLAYWVSSGHPIAWQHLTDPAVADAGQARYWPSIHGFGTVAFLAGIVLLFAGVEVQAVHVTEMKQPSREYPFAIGLGAIISLVIFTLGAIPIAAILPYEKISLQSAVFDTYNAVIADVWHVGWLVPLLSFLVGVGAISGVLRGLVAHVRDCSRPLTTGSYLRHCSRPIDTACPRPSFWCKAPW